MTATRTDTVLLVGNPNVGKSVIFSYLTGRYSIVSNYPGTTVEVSQGRMGAAHSREVIDTPGVSSLFPKSEDERVTRDLLIAHRDATVVQVADAKNLFRTLLLTTQLAELGCRTILVLNMMDEARQRGIDIDVKALAERLGIEVIPTVAVEKRGLARLAAALIGGEANVPRVSVSYSKSVREAIAEVQRESALTNELGLFGALTLISGDRSVMDEGGRTPAAILERLADRMAERQRSLPNPYSFYIAAARRDFVERLAGAVAHGSMRRPARDRVSGRALVPIVASAVFTVLLYALVGEATLAALGLSPTLPVLVVGALAVALAGERRVNRVTLHPVYGVLILLVVLYLIYELVGVFAAGAVVGVLEERLFNGLLVPALGKLVSNGWLNDFLVGDYGLVSMGLNYSISIVLPIVFVFFLLFGFLEDSGYFPRLTVLTNNAFRLVGVNGRATLPIVLGFGCVTMAVLASRILETRRERVIVVALMALAVPCSAQLGVIMAVLSAISTRGVILIACIIAVEFVLAGRLLSRFIRGGSSDFIIELPPLRVPRPGNIMLKTGARMKWFFREAFPFFILATVILFALDRSGALRGIYRIAEPVTERLLGLPAETATVFIIGFFRRDYGAAGLYRLWETGIIAGNQVIVSILVMSLFLPCLATLIVMVKELGARTALAILLFVCAASILSGSALNFLLRATGIAL